MLSSNTKFKKNKDGGKYMYLYQIPPFCVVCSENGLPSSTLSNYEISNGFELIETTCSNGHKFKIASSHPRYAFFFDDAIAQYIKQNYRESLVSLYTTLELFWTDFSAAYCLHTAEIDIPDLIHAYTSGSLKLSERKYGAFVNSFSLFYKKIIGESNDDIIGKKLHKKIESLRNLRNNVIHNGHILNDAEKIKLKSQIYDVYLYIKAIEDTFVITHTIHAIDGTTNISIIDMYYSKISSYLLNQESQDTDYTFVNDNAYLTLLSMFNLKTNKKNDFNDLSQEIKKRM